MVIGQNDRIRMSKKQDKEIKIEPEEFSRLSSTSAQLIFEAAEANKIPHTIMSNGACWYIRAICAAMKMPYKDFLKIIKNLTDDYQKDIDG